MLALYQSGTYLKSISSEKSSNCDPKFETQRTAEWFNARKGKSMEAIMTAKALGWYGKKAMIENDYWAS